MTDQKSATMSESPLGPGCTACPASVNIVKESVDQFVELARQFVVAMEEMYPSCSGIKALKLEFTMAIEHALSEELKEANSVKLIENFHHTMTPFYEKAAAHDESVFAENVRLLQQVKMAEKWRAASTDTRECIWEYVENLSKLAQTWALYSSVPNSMMSKITEAAQKLSQEVQEGGMQSLNIAHLASIGQSVVSDVDERDLQSFAQSVLSNGQMMQTCMSNMGAFAHMMPGGGGGAAGAPGAGAGAGGPNPFALASALFGKGTMQ